MPPETPLFETSMPTDSPIHPVAEDPAQRSEYWSTHFNQLASQEEGADKKLDFSNERVMIQNFAFILESLGDVAGKRVLDCGCGCGTLSRLIADLGGRVDAFDFVRSTIARLQREQPDVHWFEEDLVTWTQRAIVNTYDIVVASEVLEYVDFESTTRALVQALRMGGRLIITIPNAECQIVTRTANRFDGNYVGLGLSSIQDVLRRCAPNMKSIWRGIQFQKDQSLFPYTALDWCNTDDFKRTASINRIQIVMGKAPPAPTL